MDYAKLLRAGVGAIFEPTSQLLREPTKVGAHLKTKRKIRRS
jgi:hypothetical protein